MSKDRENELIHYILQYMLENEFASKADMARQLSIETRTVQRAFERLSDGTAKGSSIVLNRVLLFCAEKNLSMDKLFDKFCLLEGKDHVTTAAYEKNGRPAFLHICLPKPYGLTEKGERVYRYIGDFLRQASLYLCPRCNTWQEQKWDETGMGGHACVLTHMAQTMLRALDQYHTEDSDDAPED